MHLLHFGKSWNMIQQLVSNLSVVYLNRNSRIHRDCNNLLFKAQERFPVWYLSPMLLTTILLFCLRSDFLLVNVYVCVCASVFMTVVCMFLRFHYFSCQAWNDKKVCFMGWTNTQASVLLCYVFPSGNRTCCIRLTFLSAQWENISRGCVHPWLKNLNSGHEGNLNFLTCTVLQIK